MFCRELKYPCSPMRLHRFLTIIVVSAILVLGTGDWARAGTPKKGKLPPPMQWTTVDGESLTWESLRGDRPLVMVFWATWCTVCKKHWPELQKLVTKYADAPSAPAWASVSLGEDAKRVADVAAKRKLPGWIIADPDEVNGKALGIEFVPTICILDSEGRVAYFGDPKVKIVDRLLKTLTSTSSSPGASP